MNEKSQFLDAFEKVSLESSSPRVCVQLYDVPTWMKAMFVSSAVRKTAGRREPRDVIISSTYSATSLSRNVPAYDGTLVCLKIPLRMNKSFKQAKGESFSSLHSSLARAAFL